MFAVFPVSLRYGFVVVLVVVVASTAWRHRDDDWVHGLLRPEGPGKVQIQFDNGTVREPAAVVPVASDKAPENLPGQLKKCLRGKQTIYTDQPCSPDAKVAKVDGGNVTVVPSVGAKPTSRLDTGTAPAEARKTLRDALDLSGNDNIRDKMMERAVNK